MSEIQDFLDESRMSKYDAATWDTPGTRHGGIIEGKPRVVETQYGKRLVIELADGKGSGVTLWVKPGSMAQAISDACEGHGLEEGGKLEVVFTETRDTGKPSPLKVFEAQYEPPRNKVDVGSIFGDG